VSEFKTVKAAKDYLAARIAKQADHENVPLSEVERKLLYFSETDWTLPDMAQVSAEFDRDYDQDEYEQKIARLIANITADHHHQHEEEEEKWDVAVYKLSDGDHYIQVLIREADRVAEEVEHADGPGFIPTLKTPRVRPPHDILKLWITAIAAVSAIFMLIGLLNWLFGTRFWLAFGWAFGDRDTFGLSVLIVVAGYFLIPKLWQAIRMRSHRD
jgi:hypothetical protein